MKTLLITSSLPSDADVGQLLVQRMLDVVPDLPIAIAAIVADSQVVQSVDPQQPTPRKIFTEQHEHAIPRSINRWSQLSIAAKRVLHQREFARQAEQIVAFAQQHDCQQIWAVLGSLNVLEVAPRVAEMMPVPLITQVWDDIEHLARQRSFHGLALRGLRHRFARCLNLSQRTGVICETMAEDYQRKYSANPVIVRLGAEGAQSPSLTSTSKSEFNITFSGGMYCLSAWQSLMSTLDACDWAIGGKSIRIQVYCSDIRLNSSGPANVTFLGWRNEQQVRQGLRESDLLYLPQPFETHQQSLARLSFPTKLTDYVASGRPVLVHAPAHASLAVLAQKYTDMPYCGSLEPDHLRGVLYDLVASPDRYAKAARASTAIASELLRPEYFRRGVRQLLGVVPEPTAHRPTEMPAVENGAS